MTSRIVSRMARDGFRRATADATGATPAVGVRLSSARAFDLNVENAFRLPVAEDEGTPLQDPVTGDFYAIADYSDPTGPDLTPPP